MLIIVVRLPAVDLAERMTAMRLWLDDHRYEPSTFTYSEDRQNVLIRVAFKIDDEAAAFSMQFNGGTDEPTDFEHLQPAE